MATSALNDNELNPVYKLILQGVQDDGSPLSLLRGVPEIVDKIWKLVVSYWKMYIKQCSDFPYYNLGYIQLRSNQNYVENDETDLKIEFPAPKDININMMPFILNPRSFKATRLPNYLKRYWNIIERCLSHVNMGSTFSHSEWSEIGKVGYLTVQESFVDAKTSQRRPGIHIESPAVKFSKDPNGQRFQRWGGGETFFSVYLRGGIYMASNVDNSCKIWDCKIEQPENGAAVTGELGSVEHLRGFLPTGEVLKANRIYWLTDKTPHESLPMAEGTYRQFFRIVTSEVSVWYEDHSTKNPLGVVPDPNITKIVKGSKFDGTCFVADELNVDKDMDENVEEKLNLCCFGCKYKKC